MARGTRADRLEQGFTVWFTGLSGAGKSTLSKALAAELLARGRRVEVLDGDEVRTNLSRGLGFSREDRDTNVQRIAYVCQLLTRHGVAVLSAAISPYQEARAQARARIGEFVEVYVHCPMPELVRRDVKGLYARALRGEIPHFTGISDPYEAPTHPDVVVDSGSESVAASLARIVAHLELRGYIPVSTTEAGTVNRDERAGGQRP